ncbi:galactokinase [Actinomadura craniellae]|uniref:Galactokinase n=2 Tax=Actinomadura craniellae TaxID=2231787 RepID=A0A365H8K0_9ACTN|nr:galactokinase [Actinomadura craniellae]
MWHAPGRVNLIGEHTDHNDGLVLPFALAQGVTAAVARRTDGVLELRSLQAAGEGVRIAAADLAPGAVGGWAAYPAGTAWALGFTGGASIMIDADLPRGSGLSSSAALECAVALALNDLGGLGLDRPALAEAARRAEHEFAGVPCGIMDQSAALLCSAGHALLLDCRSGLSAQVPLDLTGLDLLVVDTGVRHALAGGEYAARRAECARAAAALGVAALRDVTDLGAALGALTDPVLRRRVQHVVTENHRVEATAGLLRAGAAAELGALLTASHLSLRDQFEVSWPEADLVVDAALRAGARGARMVGGGFGGSVIALTAADRTARVRERIAAALPRAAFLTAVPSPAARRL